MCQVFLAGVERDEVRHPGRDESRQDGQWRYPPPDVLAVLRVGQEQRQGVQQGEDGETQVRRTLS